MKELLDEDNSKKFNESFSKTETYRNLRNQPVRQEVIQLITRLHSSADQIVGQEISIPRGVGDPIAENATSVPFPLLTESRISGANPQHINDSNGNARVKSNQNVEGDHHSFCFAWNSDPNKPSTSSSQVHNFNLMNGSSLSGANLMNANYLNGNGVCAQSNANVKQERKAEVFNFEDASVHGTNSVIGRSTPFAWGSDPNKPSTSSSQAQKITFPMMLGSSLSDADLKNMNNLHRDGSRNINVKLERNAEDFNSDNASIQATASVIGRSSPFAGGSDPNKPSTSSSQAQNITFPLMLGSSLSCADLKNMNRLHRDGSSEQPTSPQVDTESTTEPDIVHDGDRTYNVLQTVSHDDLLENSSPSNVLDEFFTEGILPRQFVTIEELSGVFDDTGTVNYVVETNSMRENENGISEPCYVQHNSSLSDSRPISTSSRDYFEFFYSTEDSYLGPDTALWILRNHVNYLPYLEGLTDQPPPVNCKHYNAPGFGAIVVWSEDTYDQLKKGQLRASEIPGNNMDTLSSHCVIVGEWIRFIYFIQTDSSTKFALVHYCKNVHQIYLPDHNPVIRKGLLNPKQGFDMLMRLYTNAVKERLPVYYDRYPNYIYTLDSSYLNGSKEELSDDGICWSDQSKFSVTKFKCKWNTEYLYIVDVTAGIYNPIKKEVYVALDPTIKHTVCALRHCRAAHPYFKIMDRFIAYISEAEDKKKIISPCVLYQYISTWNTDLLKDPEKIFFKRRVRTGPKVMNVVRSHMQHRNAIGVQQVLQQDENIEVRLPVIYNAARHGNVSTFKKGNQGPKAKVDLLELATVVGSITGSYLVIDNVSGMKYFYVQVIMDNLKCFLAGLPTKTQLAAYRRKVSHLDTLEDRDERLRYAKTEFLDKQTTSGVIPGISGVIMVDTTFGISPSYVTIVYGSFTSFKNKRSTKPLYEAIAIIYHVNRESLTHKSVVSALEIAFSSFKEYKDRRVSCIMTDREESLKEYQRIEILVDAVHLRCCVHLNSNVCKNKRVKTSHLFGIIYERLDSSFYEREFNEEIPLNINGLPMKKRYLKNALLGALTEQEYPIIVDNFLDSEEVPAIVKKYVRRNRNVLFEYYSLRRKIEAGYIQQFASTNLIENYNGQIKRIFSGKESPDKSILKFLDYCRTRHQVMVKAVQGLAETIEYSGTQNWDILTVEEQDCLFHNLGLSPYDEDIWRELEPGFIIGCGASRMRTLKNRYDEYSIVNHIADHKFMIVVHISSNISTVVNFKVEIDYIIPECGRKCVLKGTNCCDHEVLCFLHLDSPLKILFSKGVMTRPTLNQQLAAHTKPNVGQKSKRKFDFRSRHNMDRAIGGLEDMTGLYEDMDMNEVQPEDQISVPLPAYAQPLSHSAPLLPPESGDIYFNNILSQSAPNLETTGEELGTLPDTPLSAEDEASESAMAIPVVRSAGSAESLDLLHNDEPIETSNTDVTTRARGRGSRGGGRGSRGGGRGSRGGVTNARGGGVTESRDTDLSVSVPVGSQDLPNGDAITEQVIGTSSTDVTTRARGRGSRGGGRGSRGGGRGSRGGVTNARGGGVTESRDTDLSVSVPVVSQDLPNGDAITEQVIGTSSTVVITRARGRGSRGGRRGSRGGGRGVLSTRGRAVTGVPPDPSALTSASATAVSDSEFISPTNLLTSVQSAVAVQTTEDRDVLGLPVQVTEGHVPVLPGAYTSMETACTGATTRGSERGGRRGGRGSRGGGRGVTNARGGVVTEGRETDLSGSVPAGSQDLPIDADLTDQVTGTSSGVTTRGRGRGSRGGRRAVNSSRGRVATGVQSISALDLLYNDEPTATQSVQPSSDLPTASVISGSEAIASMEPSQVTGGSFGLDSSVPGAGSSAASLSVNNTATRIAPSLSSGSRSRGRRFNPFSGPRLVLQDGPPNKRQCLNRRSY